MVQSHNDTSKTIATLLTSAIFAGVPEPLIRAMASGCETRELRAGERLLTAGDPNSILYLVLRGALGVRLSGSPVAIKRVLPGDCAGELSLIDGSQVSADVYAEEDSELLVIDREHVWHFMEQTPLVGRNLLRLLAGRVRNDDRMLEESERLKREYEDAATVDVLTGLRNRRWLNDAFTRQLERSARSRHAVSLLMVDVDRFKEVNDRHGHLVGDEVLVQLGHTVAGALRPQDLLARFGGEEFVVLLPDVPHVEATAVAERLREAVGSSPVLTSVGLLGGLSVSIGVATQTAGPSTSLSALLDAADRALYEAKAAGRNCVRG